MPILESEGLRIDYEEAGAGDPVLLVHSSVSGSRQWRRLAQDLAPRFRVRAPNLFGYGETSPWAEDGTQTLTDQAMLVTRLVRDMDGPVRLVGHSFGGSVALKAAAMLGERVSHLFLFEPNPFYLLAQNGLLQSYAEATALRIFIKVNGARGDWAAVAARFVDYWVGDGAWAAMPEDRRAAYVHLLRPNYYEWDCMESDTTPIEAYARMRGKTLLVYGANARRPIREVAQLFARRCARWSVQTIAAGGHMAPLTHPDLVNPIVMGFLCDIPEVASSRL
jgi:pimeloyl-ACP methyl ester carboxylesterase